MFIIADSYDWVINHPFSTVISAWAGSSIFAFAAGMGLFS